MSERIEYVNPCHLKPDPNNPRTEMDEEFIEKLAENYREHGIIEPIEVDENNVIRRGHQRVEAAKRVGIDRVPVRRVVGLSEEKWFERQLADDELRKKLGDLDRMWAFATGIVNINTGKFHTIKEIKEMWEKDSETLLNLIELGTKEGVKHKRMGQAELERRIGVKQETIHNHVILLKIEKEYPGTLEAIRTGKTNRSKVIEAYRIKNKELRDATMKAVLEGKFKDPAVVGGSAIRVVKSVMDEQPAELVKPVAKRIESGELTGDKLEGVLTVVKSDDITKEVKARVTKGEISPERVIELTAIPKKYSKPIMERIEKEKLPDYEVERILSVIRNEKLPEEVKEAIAKGFPADLVDVAVNLYEASKPIDVSMIPTLSEEELEKAKERTMEWDEEHIRFSTDFGIQVRRLYLPLKGDLFFIHDFASKRICPLCGKPLKLRLDCCNVTVEEAQKVAQKAWETKTPPNETMRRIIEERMEKEVTRLKKEFKEKWKKEAKI